MSLSREQYNEIMRVISQRHSNAYNRLRSKQEEVEGQLPAIRVYNEQISELSVRRLKAGLGRGTDDAAELDARIGELKEKKRRLMTDAGYAEDDLELHFYCDKCKDTGYVGNEKCSCFKRLETELLNRESGLPALLARDNFGSFRFDIFDNSREIEELKPKRVTQLDYMRSTVMQSVKDFIDGFDHKKGSNILMIGAPGTGKTFLSNCIAKALIDSRHTVLYERANDLVDAFSSRDFKRGDYDKAAGRIDRVNDCELLIIDDLGTEFTNDYSKSRLFEVIEGRLSRGLSTIISTNLSLNQLRAVYGARITSRFIGGYTLLPFYGTDLRSKKNGRGYE